ncbi:MAG: hypothetical protein WCT41_00435 [Candidatus Paceibacterota bacterium]|jgi:hypothetical protein
MSRNPFAGALATVLITILIVPVAFFAAPQKARAAGGIFGAVSCVGGLLGIGSTALTSTVTALAGVPVTNLLMQSNTSVSASSNATDCITTSIIMPLARALARMILQQITASTINWINGGNGTGQPSFVLNLGLHLQSVGNAVAIPFINQITAGFNSPFGPAIASSLMKNYSQQTSMAGFFAANQSTLAKSSPNQTAFLTGNWVQGGGIPAWFALTTQDQNNPYTLYQVAQSQLGSQVNQAQTNRRQDLMQSGGFLSWCGVDNTTSSSGAAGVSPGVSCINKDNTPGKVQTPGSVILGYTQKTLGSGIDQLVNAQDLDAALGAIVTTLIRNVLGGTGLFGVSQSSSSGAAPITTQLQNYAADNASASASAASIAQSKAAQVTSYVDAWNTIAIAADTASTTAAGLATFCVAAADTAAEALINSGNTAEGAVFITPSPAAIASTHSVFIDASRAQAVAAHEAITTLIDPVLIQALAAPGSVSATQAFALKVESEALALTSLTTVNTAATDALTADTQTLSAMPPTAADVATIQENAQAFGGARATPDGSLTVAGSSIVDRMNLIKTNAEALKTTVCNPNSSLYVTYDTTYSSGG